MSESNTVNIRQTDVKKFAGIVLVCYDEFLLVKEAKKESSSTDSGKWCLPGGNVEASSDFERTAACKGTSSSAYDFDIGCIRYVGLRTDSDSPSIVVIYSAKNPYALSFTDSPNPEEIVGREWFSYDDIVDMAKSGQICDPEIVMSAINNERAGIEISCEEIKAYESKYSEESSIQAD